MHASAEAASPGLVRIGLGPVRVPASLRFMPIRLPADLWYTEHTQNGDLHVSATGSSISVRMHIDTFHGSRPLNEAALDIVQGEIEPDLRKLAPADTDFDWRAARGGNNQVLALTSSTGGPNHGVPEQAARWVVEAANAIVTTLRHHPIPDLRERAERLESSQ